MRAALSPPQRSSRHDAIAPQVGSTRPLPRNWRERMPDPSAYYKAHLASLTATNATGWAQAQCPLHDDSNASLSVHLTDPRGAWRCERCGGGDLLGFHIKRRGVDFRTAVRELISFAGSRNKGDADVAA